MGLFGKKSKDKEPEAPAYVPEPAAPARAPEASAPEIRAPEPQPAPMRQPEPEPVAAAPTPQPAPVAAQPQQAAAPAPSQEEIQRAVGESQQAMLAVGHIMTFLMNSEEIKNTSLQQARSIVWPAVMTQQFIVAMAQSNKTGHVTPVGLALWANVSDEVNGRLERELDKPFNLTQAEWNSGPHTWLIMLAGDNRAINPLVADFQKTRLGGRPMKMRVPDGAGSSKIEHFAHDPAQAPAAN